MKEIQLHFLIPSSLTCFRGRTDLLPVDPFDHGLLFSGRQMGVGQEIQTRDSEEDDRHPVGPDQTKDPSDMLYLQADKIPACIQGRCG